MTSQVSTKIALDLSSQAKAFFTEDQDLLLKEIVGDYDENEVVACAFIANGGINIAGYLETVFNKDDKFNVDMKIFYKFINRNRNKKHSEDSNVTTQQKPCDTRPSRASQFTRLAHSSNSVTQHSLAASQSQSSTSKVSNQQNSCEDRPSRASQFTRRGNSSNLGTQISLAASQSQSVTANESMDCDDRPSRANQFTRRGNSSYSVTQHSLPHQLNASFNQHNLYATVVDRTHQIYLDKRGAIHVKNSLDIHCNFVADQRKLNAGGFFTGRATTLGDRNFRVHLPADVATRVMQNFSQDIGASQDSGASQLSLTSNASRASRASSKPQVLPNVKKFSNNRSSRAGQFARRGQSSGSQNPSQNSSTNAPKKSSQLDIRNFFGEPSGLQNLPAAKRSDSSSHDAAKRRDSSSIGLMRRDSSSGLVNRRDSLKASATQRRSSSNHPVATRSSDNVEPVTPFNKAEATHLLKSNQHWKKVSAGLKDKLEQMLRMEICDTTTLELYLAFYVDSQKSNQVRPGEEFDRAMKFEPGTLLRALIKMDVCGVISELKKRLDQFTPAELLENDFYAGITGNKDERMHGHRSNYEGVEMVEFFGTKTRETAVFLEFVCIGFLRQLERSGRIKRCFNSHAGYDTPSTADGDNSVYLLFCPDSTKAPNSGYRYSKKFRMLRTDGKVFSISTSQTIASKDKSVSKFLYTLGSDALQCKVSKCKKIFETEAKLVEHQLMEHEDTKTIELQCMACSFHGVMSAVNLHLKSEHGFDIEAFARQEYVDRLAAKDDEIVEDLSQPMEIDE